MWGEVAFKLLLSFLQGKSMADDTPLVVKISDYYRRVVIGLSVLAGVSLAVMMLSTTFDTILRYFFNSPISGVFELNEVALVVCVFLGLAWCQVEKGHIRVTLLLIRLSPKAIVIMDTIGWVVAFIFVLIMAVQTWHYAEYAFSIKLFRWGKVQMPIWWAIGLVPISLWLLCIQFILDIWTNIYRLSGRLPLEISELRSLNQKSGKNE